MARGYTAAGNIAPARFVKEDSTAKAGKVLQCSAATDKIIGVSQPGTHNAPLSIGSGTLDDGYVATAGLDVNVCTVGDRCMVQSGGAFNPGDPLTSDGSGKAVAATAGQQVGGYAEQQATAADYLVEMRVQPYLGTV